MKISIIGSGVVGSRIGISLSKKYDVIFYDLNKKVIDDIASKGYKVTTNIDEAIEKSEISFVAVPTPTTNEKSDTKFIIQVAEECGKVLKNKEDFHIFVLKSTVVPGTTEKIFIPILEKFSGKKLNKDFGVVYSPEFLTVIHNTWTNDPNMERSPETEDRIVLGESNKKTGDIVESLFRFFEKPIIRTNYKTAEMIKYASNCALASKISYWNEIYLICMELGIDSNFVAKVVSMDNRIGKYGTVHQKAFGGQCLPKDLQAFIAFAEENTTHNPIYLKAIKDINEKIKKLHGVRE